MASKNTQKKKTMAFSAAAATVGLLVIGTAVYKSSRSKKPSQTQPHKLVFEDGYVEDAGEPEEEQVTNNTDEVMAQRQETRNVHMTEDSGSTQGLYRDANGCWRSEETNVPQIRNGFQFGDPRRTEDIKAATKELYKRWGLNEYM